MKKKLKMSPDEVYGVLPDWVIKSHIKNGRIKINNLSPDWDEDVDQVTIDFHLGRRFLVPTMGRHFVIDTRKGVNGSMYQELNLKEGEPITLRPDQFLIAQTKEEFRLPSDIIGRLEGKSSLARLGIVIHQTSARFDPGWDGPAVLEIRNNSDNDVILYCGDKICALAFERIMYPVENPYVKKNFKKYKRNEIMYSQIHKDNHKNRSW